MVDGSERPVERPRSLLQLAAALSALVEHRLWLKVLIGMGAGLLAGAALGPAAGIVDGATGAWIGGWLALPGQLFIASIQMIVVPLIVASIVLGVCSSDSTADLKRLGLAVTGYFVITTAIAAIIGIGVAMLLAPGVALRGAVPAAVAIDVPTPSSLPRLSDLPEKVIGLLPGNPLNAMAEGQMLQVVIFSVVIGVALAALPGTQSRPMLDLLRSTQQVCMMVVRWAMWLAPVAVFGLTARVMTQLGVSALLGMAQYVLTVLIGLSLLFGLYLVIVTAVTRVGPKEFLRSTRELLLLAFSTSSSAAVMPMSIKTAQEKLNVRASVAQFVVPLGATINMNGTALYQGAAAVFLAQAYGVDIGVGGMALVVTLAVGASIGSPATPGVGIVILATVLASVGIPPEGIALILGVDRILDMSRTAINVAGDLVASLFMDRWLGARRDADTVTAEAH